MHKLEYARKQTDKLIQGYSCSLMSNTKWVKLLCALSDIEEIECKANVKLVWDENPRDMRIDDELVYDFDFYGKSMEALISGYPKGWYDYKEIEWLQLTGSNELIDQIKFVLDKIGKFEIEKISNGIKLFAYK